MGRKHSQDVVTTVAPGSSRSHRSGAATSPCPVWSQPGMVQRHTGLRSHTPSGPGGAQSRQYSRSVLEGVGATVSNPGAAQPPGYDAIPGRMASVQETTAAPKAACLERKAAPPGAEQGRDSGPGKTRGITSR